MKRPATIRKEYERYADARQLNESVLLFQEIRTSTALQRQAKAVLFFIQEGLSETSPMLAERELIRLIADVALLVMQHKGKQNNG